MDSEGSPESLAHCEHDLEAGQPRIEDEEVEELIVVESYAVPDPWTVMVHF
jgi:hypothetical protein